MAVFPSKEELNVAISKNKAALAVRRSVYIDEQIKKIIKTILSATENKVVVQRLYDEVRELLEQEGYSVKGSGQLWTIITW